MNKCLCLALCKLVLLRFQAATVAFSSFHFYLNFKHSIFLSLSSCSWCVNDAYIVYVRVALSTLLIQTHHSLLRIFFFLVLASHRKCNACVFLVRHAIVDEASISWFGACALSWSTFSNKLLKWTLLRIYGEFGGRYRVFLGVINLQWSGETRMNPSSPSMSRTFCNPGDWVKKGAGLGERVEVHVLRL